MAKILAVVNQKGGVGKSTLAVHLAYKAREEGLSVLLVDLDPQGSTTFTFCGEREGGLTSADFFAETMPQAAPLEIKPGLSIVRADFGLMSIGAMDKAALKVVAGRIRSLAAPFDVAIIDTPGSFGEVPAMAPAAMTAADAMVVPFGIGPYESQAMAVLWGYIHKIKSQGFNPRLQLLGLLPSKINSKSKEERKGLDELRNSDFGPAILPFMLSERASVKQAIMLRRPVWLSTRGASQLAAAKEWRDACEGILVRLGVMK